MENPLLWHLLQSYSLYGLNDFVLCLGFLGEQIKRYFIERRWLDSEFVLNKNEIQFLSNDKDKNWKITFAETGLDTNTGGRLKKVEKHLKDEKQFCVTYGDGLSNVNIEELIKFHKSHKRIATLTTIQPSSNFGILKLDDKDFVTEFHEKPPMNEWINGGFFVFTPKIFDYLGENSVLEKEPFESLAKDRELLAFRHRGFWKCMDTYKDKLEFDQIWKSGKANWHLRK